MRVSVAITFVNVIQFSRLVDANRILSDPVLRAKYDANYESVREARWQIFGQQSATNEIAADSRVRLAVLSILYVARRNSAQEPGVGIVELERLLCCPEPLVRFHVWYLRENGWIQRLETRGGVAPATGGDDAHVGAQTLTPYSADYFFYHTAPAGQRVHQCSTK